MSEMMDNDNNGLKAIEEMLGLSQVTLASPVNPVKLADQTEVEGTLSLSEVFNGLASQEPENSMNDKNDKSSKSSKDGKEGKKKLTASQIKRMEKEAAKEQERSTIEMLSIIHDKVQKSKRADRYIVGNKNGNWAVVDSNGKIIIPFNYTRITSSNDKFFRAYEDYDTTINSFNGILYKTESIIDYDGNILTEPMVFTSNYSLGKSGLLLGQGSSRSLPCDYKPVHQIWLLSYITGESKALGTDFYVALFHTDMPEFIMLNSKTKPFTAATIEDVECAIFGRPQTDLGVQIRNEFACNGYVRKLLELKSASDEEIYAFMDTVHNYGVSGNITHAIRLDRGSLEILKIEDAIDEVLSIPDFVKSTDRLSSYQGQLEGQGVKIEKILSGVEIDLSNKRIIRVGDNYMLASYIQSDTDENTRLIPIQYLGLDNKRSKIKMVYSS